MKNSPRQLCRKAFCLFVAALMAFAVPIFADDGSVDIDDYYDIDAAIDAIMGEGFSENQREALQTAERMTAAWEYDEYGSLIWPDYLGGAYIDDDGGFVILIVESMRDYAIDIAIPGIVTTPNTRRRYVEHSYNYLWSLTTHIRAERNIGREMGCVYALNISRVDFDVRSNNISIGLAVFNDEMIAGLESSIFANSSELAFAMNSSLIALEQRDFAVTLGAQQSSPFAIFASNTVVIILTLGALTLLLTTAIFTIVKTKKKRMRKRTLQQQLPPETDCKGGPLSS